MCTHLIIKQPVYNCLTFLNIFVWIKYKSISYVYVDLAFMVVGLKSDCQSLSH